MYPFQFFSEKPGEQRAVLPPLFIEKSPTPQNNNYFINFYFKFDIIDNYRFDRTIENHFKQLARQAREQQQYFEMYAMLSPSRKYPTYVLQSYNIIERNPADELQWSAESLQLSEQIINFIEQQISDELNQLEGYHARHG